MAGSASPTGADSGGPAPLSDIEIVAIEHACSKLYQRLGVAADSDFDGFVECFSPGVVWKRPTMTMRGHDEVKAFLAQELERTRQHASTGHLTRHHYTTI